MTPPNLHQMPLADVVAACREQTAIFLKIQRSNESFCLELFRRAIVQRDQRAWEMVVEVYQPEIKKMIHAKGFREAEADELTQVAFVKFWRAYNASKFFHAADLLGKVRGYLNACATSAIEDARRKKLIDGDLLPIGTSEDDDDGVEIDPPDPKSSEMEAQMDDKARRQLWDCVRRHCKDEADLLLVHQVWVEGIKPRAIYQAHKNLFANQQEIYQRIRNLKDRLSRDPDAQALWEIFSE